MHHSTSVIVETRGRGLYDITSVVQGVVSRSGIEAGLCTVFIHHTSASLVISENADPDVCCDLEAFFTRLVPDGDELFRHVAEGPDDMSAHVRSCLTQTSLSVPVRSARCDFGTWQGIYVWEHRERRHDRKVSITIVG